MTESASPVVTPEWFLLLEKKKNRPHRLAHEIGAGAPCWICEEKCPGLDLHFWRKLCRNCKCKKEDHDVKDDDGYEQFEILLGAGGKRKKPGAVLKIKVPEVSNDAIITTNTSVPFDWVPPNVSEDVAAEYMGQLPTAKLPISGSDGALYRKQQLERQMPLHDLDASRCHNLTPQETEELQKYLDNLKNNVVGQGRVTKVPTLYTEQRHFYKGATIEHNVSHQVSVLPSSRSEQSFHALPPFSHAYNATPRPFVPQLNNEDLPPPLPTSLPPEDTASNLKMPGYFLKNIPQTDNNSGKPSEYPFDSSPASTGINSASQYDTKFQPLDGQKLSSQYPQNVAHSTSVPHQMSSELSQLCLNRDSAKVYSQDMQSPHQVFGSGPPSAIHYSSDTVHSSTVPEQISPSMSCPLKDLENSGKYSQNNSKPTIIPGHLQDPGSVSNIDAFSRDGSTLHSQRCQNIAHSTVAPGLTPGMSVLHGSRAPLPSYSEDGSKFVPGQMQDTGTGSVAYSQDGSTFHSQHPENVSYSTLAPGQTVPGMSHLQQGNFNEITDQMSNGKVARNRNLNNPIGSQHSNETWLENTQMPAPSHFEYSFQPQYDVSVSSDIGGDSMPRSAHVMQQSHPDDLTLSSQLNSSAQEQKVKSHLSCQHCREPLTAGDVAVFADRAGDNTAWHPNCFVCKTCDELLVDLIYFFNKGNVYCGRHFAELLNIPRCYACDELIFVKEYTVAEGKTFHVKHFCCYECDGPLAGKQYVPVDDQPTCLDCYQEIFGKRCHTCKKQIAAGERRVGWKELNWHAVEECFCCHGCAKSLLGGKFVMRDEKPYCNKECVELLTSGY